MSETEKPKTAKVKTEKPKTAKVVTGEFVYIGSYQSTRIWDGQTVAKGDTFTTVTTECTEQCRVSPLFEDAPSAD